MPPLFIPNHSSSSSSSYRVCKGKSRVSAARVRVCVCVCVCLCCCCYDCCSDAGTSPVWERSHLIADPTAGCAQTKPDTLDLGPGKQVPLSSSYFFPSSFDSSSTSSFSFPLLLLLLLLLCLLSPGFLLFIYPRFLAPCCSSCHPLFAFLVLFFFFFFFQLEPTYSSVYTRAGGSRGLIFPLPTLRPPTGGPPSLPQTPPSSPLCPLLGRPLSRTAVNMLVESREKFGCLPLCPADFPAWPRAAE